MIETFFLMVYVKPLRCYFWGKVIFRGSNWQLQFAYNIVEIVEVNWAHLGLIENRSLKRINFLTQKFDVKYTTEEKLAEQWLFIATCSPSNTSFHQIFNYKNKNEINTKISITHCIFSI